MIARPRDWPRRARHNLFAVTSLLASAILGVIVCAGSASAQMGAAVDSYELATAAQRDALSSVPQVPESWMSALPFIYRMEASFDQTTFAIMRLCADPGDDYCLTLFFVDSISGDGFRGAGSFPRLTTRGDAAKTYCARCGNVLPLFFEDAEGQWKGVGMIRDGILF